MSTDALHTLHRSLMILLPEFLIIGTAIVMMTAGVFKRLPRRTWSAISAAVLIVAFLMAYALGNFSTTAIAYGSVVLNDAMAWYARLGLIFTGLVLLCLAHDQVDDDRAPEFFGSILMIHAGAMLVVAANELVFLFVGLELVSIPTYLLLYLPRRNAVTLEAATKYFYLSIFSSGMLLFGLAYLYGLAGVSNLKALSVIFHAAPDMIPSQFALIAMLFVIAGLGFRAAAVPFHFYAPDVYQGSPTVVAALMAWVPKAIGFVAMIRVLTAVFGGSGLIADKGVQMAWVIAVASMTLGNTVAMMQQNLLRLLAYSSIAHAGYLMIGVAAGFFNGPDATAAYLGAQGVVFYLAAYAFMTLGVFGGILLLSTPGRTVENVDDLAGLARSRPLAAFGLAICLFSLAGVPPFVGFWGKFLVFSSALAAGSQATNPARSSLFTLLTVIGCVNAAIGAYYYLRIVVVMYLRPPAEDALQPKPGWPTRLAVATCAGLSLVLGLVPGPLFRASQQAAVSALAVPGIEGLKPVQTAGR